MVKKEWDWQDVVLEIHGKLFPLGAPAVGMKPPLDPSETLDEEEKPEQGTVLIRVGTRYGGVPVLREGTEGRLTGNKVFHDGEVEVNTVYARVTESSPDHLVTISKPGLLPCLQGLKWGFEIVTY